MLFNSFTFLFFLPVVFLIYWRLRSVRRQNIFLILASYFFYGLWDWRFLILILVSSIVDYIIGLRLHAVSYKRARKRLLWASVVVNLGILGFFKYFNFFIGSFTGLIESVGLSANVPSLQVILPVGISFYTFQTLSYSIDIYRRKISPTRDAVAFFAFVSFFPQLVAGPIERAKTLLPQFLNKRQFDLEKAKDGLRQMLWGFFKKVVVADTCAVLVDACFTQHDQMNGWSLVLGVVLFAFQIYGDFSGYTDIALGAARLLGFDLMRNFAYPYFSRDIAEFWRRWHISLSSWFRDYLYIPLGGSLVHRWKRIRNIIITFTVSGLWHGASWNFVVWGLINGMYYIPLMLADRQKRHTAIVAEHSMLPSLTDCLNMAATFMITCLAWVFFRASDLPQAFTYLRGILTGGLGEKSLFDENWIIFGYSVMSVITLLLFEWLQRRKEHALDVQALPLPIRWLLYLIISSAVVGFWGGARTFIYFQF